MKISPILAQYLYSHKRLDLPGIGSFLLDSSAEAYNDNTRQAKPAVLEGVSFEPDNTIKEAPELIAYISAQTGKIKALAAADLESHLELAKQFLNIGKPYLFEGIGTLSRIKGEYTFTPGYTINEPIKDTAVKTSGSVYQDEPADYKEVFYSKKKEVAWKKPLTLLLVIAGIGLAVWGGYKVYKNASGNKPITAPPAEASNNSEMPASNDTDTAKNITPQTNPVNDTARQSNSTPVQPLAPLPSGMWKFVVETAVKDRALKRFAKLQTIGVKSVQMETRDSVSFKIYFALPASVADTARILDSLRRNYTPSGNRAYVEK